jgi:hypothetical protein
MSWMDVLVMMMMMVASPNAFVFNTAVDHVKLGIIVFFEIVKNKPMDDLGTIKR